MQLHIRKLLFFLLVGVLSLSFLFLIGIIFMTLRAPERMINLVEQFVPEATPIPVRLKGVAVIGDSTSDEYRGDDQRGLTYAPTTLNWVEILEKYRDINFGPWGIWGEPRRTGYAYDWARTGATVNSMLESGQDVGVAKQVREGKVNLVIIAIGANDYAPYITPDGYDAIYNGSVTDEQLLRKNNRVVADIKTAIDTIRRRGNVPILLIKIPDWGKHLGIKVAFPLPDRRQRVSEAITAVNNNLQKIAEERGIRTLDPNAFYDAQFVGREEDLAVGDVKLNAFLPGDDPHSLFLEDGVHLGTLGNGLYANFIIAALRQYYALPIRPFSASELQSIAGL